MAKDLVGTPLNLGDIVCVLRSSHGKCRAKVIEIRERYSDDGNEVIRIRCILENEESPRWYNAENIVKFNEEE